MTRDEEPVSNAPKFEFKHVPFARISRKISEGLSVRIDPSELAAEIRKHGVEKMPPDVIDFLCDHLDDKIDRRGRRGDTDAEKREIARAARVNHTIISMVESKDPDAQPEALDLYAELLDRVGEAYTPGERRWRMVSCMIYGHEGHHKKLQNLASAYYPRPK